MSAYTHAELAAGLRDLADFIEATPDLPLPYSPDLTIYATSYQPEKGVPEAAAVARLLGRCEKSVDSTLDKYVLTRHFGPLALRFMAQRSAVCERREVVKTVVEWVCPDSLLAAAEAAAPADTAPEAVG